MADSYAIATKDLNTRVFPSAGNYGSTASEAAWEQSERVLITCEWNPPSACIKRRSSTGGARNLGRKSRPLPPLGDMVQPEATALRTRLQEPSEIRERVLSKPGTAKAGHVRENRPLKPERFPFIVARTAIVMRERVRPVVPSQYR